MVLSLAATLACGGDGGEGGGTSPSATSEASQDDLLEVCAANQSWIKRCKDSNPDFVSNLEWAEKECPMLPWRYVKPAFIQANAACLRKLACGESGHVCSREGHMALGFGPQSWPYDPRRMRCIELTATCGYTSGDPCGWAVIFDDQGRAVFDACLERPCEQFEACLGK